MLPGKERQDIMSAEEIRDELRKLVESEKSENEVGSEADASFLEEAIASIDKFIAAEEKEEPMNETELPIEKNEGIVDTGVLTGPIGGLKNFLLQKQRDNAAQ